MSRRGSRKPFEGVNAVAAGAFLLALGIAFGAFGAHALGDVGPERLRWWTTAAQYHFIAASGVLALGLLRLARPVSVAPVWLFSAGLLLFSGSLYAMALSGPRWLGAVTPLGGLCLMAGFVWLGIAALGANTTAPPP